MTVSKITVTGLLLCVICSAASADSARDYQQSIDRIGGEISKISRNLNANKKLLKSEQDKVFELDRAIGKLQTELKQITEQLNSKQQEVQRLDQALADARVAQTSNRDALKTLIESRYRTGKRDYIKRFLNQQNPYEVGRLNHYHQFFSSALQARLNELSRQIKQTQQLHAEQQKAISELVLSREKQTTLKQQTETRKAQRTQAVARLSKKVDASENKLEELKKDRQRLNLLLQQIAKQAEEMRQLEAQRERELAERRARENKPAQKTTRPPVAGGFLKQKGRLRLPVNAVPRTKFGIRLPESGMRSQGMFFDTDGAQPVTSIYRGRVLFADFLKGYGLLIIVDHGDDHISLYGHNELLYKQVGDTVETNEVIAKTGVTGGLKSTGLYFEIRHNATPINPAAWCQ